MCNPLALMATAQIGQTVLGYSETRRQAALADAAILENLAADNAALDEQQEQLRAQAVEEMSERARAAMIERGKLRAIGAESGVSGISQERALAESHFNEGQDIASIEANKDSALAQSERERTNAHVTARRRTAGVKRPSLLGAGLQIAGTAAEYGTRKKDRKV